MDVDKYCEYKMGNQNRQYANVIEEHLVEKELIEQDYIQIIYNQEQQHQKEESIGGIFGNL